MPAAEEALKAGEARRVEEMEVIHSAHQKEVEALLSNIAVLDTAILYWTYRAELTNDPSFRVNQK